MTDSQKSDETATDLTVAAASDTSEGAGTEATNPPASAAPEEAAPEETPSAAPAAGPRPSAPSPAAFASRPKPAAAAPAAAPVPAAPSTSVAEASKWGRVEGDGHVYLTIDGGEHPVGQYPGVSGEEALIYFARKYDDVVAQIVLLEQRVSSKAPSTDM